MLILTRKPGESINIQLPDDRIITVTITEVNDRQVKIGFDADIDILIRRSELLENGSKPD